MIQIQLKFISIFIGVFFLFLSGKAFALEEVHRSYFSSNSAVLNDEEKEQINYKVSLIPKDSTVWVIGYSDQIGEEDSNLILSKKRAQSVKEYLKSRPEFFNTNFKVLAVGVDNEQMSKFLKRRVEILSEIKHQQQKNIIREIATDKSNSEPSHELVSNNTNIKSDTDSNENTNTNENKNENENLSIENNKIDIQNDISSQLPNELPTNEIGNVEKSNVKTDEVKETPITDVAKKLEQNKENSILDDLNFELKLNYFLASQNAHLSNSNISNNDLLTDPRFSGDLDINKKMNTAWSLGLQLGLRRHEYSKDLSTNLIKDWNQNSYRFNIGMIYHKHSYWQSRLDLGYDQILNYKFNSLGEIENGLEPIIKLNFSNLFKIVILNRNVFIGPQVGLIIGTQNVNTGLSYGVMSKFYIDKQNKYFIHFNYELTNYKLDQEIFRPEILELGLGLNF